VARRGSQTRVDAILGDSGVKSDLEAIALNRIEREGLPRGVGQYRFASPRRWQFDRAWPLAMVALELEGGVYSGGRHTRGKGFEADAEKYNTAAIRGWVVIRCTRRMVESGDMVNMLRQALNARGGLV
jgi:hypothetical protein